jgi:hypothetical protein
MKGYVRVYIMGVILCMVMRDVSASIDRYPPLYPCHNASNAVSISMGEVSNEWMKLDESTAIVWPNTHVFSSEHAWDEDSIFAGIGPSTGIQTLSVTRSGFRVGNYDSQGVKLGETEKTVGELLGLSAQSSNGIINSAGFLPIMSDQYVWFTVTGKRNKYLYIVYIPNVHQGTYSTWAYSLDSYRDIEDVYGCSCSDHIGTSMQKMTIACMFKQSVRVSVVNANNTVISESFEFRTTVMKTSLMVNNNNGVWDVVQYPGVQAFRFDVLLQNPYQSFPIHLSNTDGDTLSGSIYYRCSPDVYNTDRVWCRRRYLNDVLGIFPEIPSLPSICMQPLVLVQNRPYSRTIVHIATNK